jgi:hypothetical protein
LAYESAHVVSNEFAHVVSVLLLVFSIVIGPEWLGPKEIREVLFNEHLVKCFHFAPDAPQVGLLQWEVVHVYVHVDFICLVQGCTCGVAVKCRVFM